MERGLPGPLLWPPPPGSLSWDTETSQGHRGFQAEGIQDTGDPQEAGSPVISGPGEHRRPWRDLPTSLNIQSSVTWERTHGRLE